MAAVSFRRQGKLPTKNLIKRTWHVVDARDEVVGRLASRLAVVVSGKHKPTFTPSIDDGDSVVVLNADKVKFTGDKWRQKLYRSHSGYAGGLKEIPAWRLHQKHPTKVLEKAVSGMLPRNSFRNARVRRLKLYTGDKHPHIHQTGPYTIKKTPPRTITPETLPDFDRQPWVRRFEPWEVEILKIGNPNPHLPSRKQPRKTPYFVRRGSLSPRERRLKDEWEALLAEHGGNEHAAVDSLTQTYLENQAKSIKWTKRND